VESINYVATLGAAYNMPPSPWHSSDLRIVSAENINLIGTLKRVEGSTNLP